MKPAIPILIASGLVATAEAAIPTVEQMRGRRRVLVLAAPRADDSRLVRQRQMLTDWTQGAKDRDVSVVAVIGSDIIGASEPPRDHRRPFGLSYAAMGMSSSMA